jgi:Kdo2-lipid IVA lauroyltransferase/acyltransferase
VTQAGATRTAWSRRQRVKNDILYATAAALVGGTAVLPRSWLRRLGRLLGDVAFLVLGSARRLATDNIGLVAPDLGPGERRRLARRVFRALGTNLGDTAALLRPDERPETTLALPKGSAEVLREALGQGRGVVYVTAHLGPWEHMAPLLCERGFPITTVARESYDPRFHRLLYDPIRTRRGVEVIYRGQPGAAFAIVRALRRGRVVGFPSDLPGRVPVVDVTLLGAASRLPVGPARIALRMGSPIVVGTPAPCPGRTPPFSLAIELVPTFDLERTPAGEVALTQRLSDVLGSRIRSLPLDWPWMHPSFAHSEKARIADVWQGSLDSAREGRRH